MPDHELRQLIEAADRAITAEDFDALMEFYDDDATLVVRPGQNATGKLAIRRAFEAIAAHFRNRLKVRQGQMQVIEGGGTALVIMETILETPEADTPVVRRATCGLRPVRRREVFPRILSKDMQASHIQRPALRSFDRNWLLSGDAAMAKGQQKGNREAKKPKQNKVKASATPSTFQGKIATAADRTKSGKN